MKPDAEVILQVARTNFKLSTENQESEHAQNILLNEEQVKMAAFLHDVFVVTGCV